MSAFGSRYITTPIELADEDAGFSCGKHPLDDYFVRHALANDQNGICRAYVLRSEAELPRVLGFYKLSMASVESARSRPVTRVMATAPGRAHIPRTGSQIG